MVLVVIVATLFAPMRAQAQTATALVSNLIEGGGSGDVIVGGSQDR